MRMKIAFSFPSPTSTIMPHKKKANDTNSAEEFSDVSSSSNTDESVAGLHDNWTFPVVSHKAKREEYESVSELECARPSPHGAN